MLTHIYNVDILDNVDTIKIITTSVKKSPKGEGWGRASWQNLTIQEKKMTKKFVLSILLLAFTQMLIHQPQNHHFLKKYIIFKKFNSTLVRTWNTKKQASIHFSSDQEITLNNIPNS